MDCASISGVQKWAARSRGSFGLVLNAPFGVTALLSAPAVLEGGWGDYAFDTAAWLLFVAGALVRWWATLYIESRKGLSLITEGPYSMCRNPLYVGTLLMALAVVVYFKSLTFAAGMILAASVYLSTTISVEEAWLRNLFGDSYVRYCRAVPRLVPQLQLFHARATVEVSIRGLIAEGLRAARWLWIPVLCELVDHLRIESWWPQVFSLP